MCFVIRRSLYWDWKGQPDPRPNEVALINLHDQEKAPTRAREFALFSWQSQSSESLWAPETGSDTYDMDFREYLRKYMTDFFNHKLQTSPESPSLLGKVAWIETGKETDMDYTNWNLESDASINPSRRDWADLTARNLNFVKPMFLVGGCELISPPLNYFDMDWVPVIDNIFSHNFDGDHGIWMSGEEGLHVHLALADDGLTLDVIKNVIALYGLFTNEIEKWVDLKRRDCEWCQSVRRGMETLIFRDDRTPTGRNRGLKYTPQEFTKRIYKAPSLNHLTKEIHGERRAD
jgi:hypothetical protein